MASLSLAVGEEVTSLIHDFIVSLHASVQAFVEWSPVTISCGTYCIYSPSDS